MDRNGQTVAWLRKIDGCETTSTLIIGVLIIYKKLQINNKYPTIYLKIGTMPNNPGLCALKISPLFISSPRPLQQIHKQSHCAQTLSPQILARVRVRLWFCNE